MKIDEYLRLNIIDSEKYKVITDLIVSDTLSQIETQLKQGWKIFEHAIKTNSLPPIKGEITRGKVRWRGIKCFTKFTGTGHVQKWLEQRGVAISPIIEF